MSRKRSEYDREYRERKAIKNKRLEWFDLCPNMLERSERPKIGVLVIKRITDRASTQGKGFFSLGNIGLNAVLNELNQVYDYCEPSGVNQYETILVSLTSVMDVENLIYNLELYAPEDIKPQIIIGGFGVINIRLLLPYIDVAVFGRAEGQINDIIAGQRFNNVWRKVDDPALTVSYELRQPRYLVKGESSVGCRYKCAFCQYGHARQQIGGATPYHTDTINVKETDWNALRIDKAGRYNTAWDGWSETTRLKVKKPITDNLIIAKFMGIEPKGISGCINIKVFMIVGYPWETIAMVQSDIADVASMLAGIDKQIRTRYVISFHCTPFGPEPLTPMQCNKAQIGINWRKEIGGKTVFKGDRINAFISPVVMGQYVLVKRVMINRAGNGDIGQFKRVAFNHKLSRLSDPLKVAWLVKHGEIDADMFGKINDEHSGQLEIGTNFLSIEPRQLKQLNLRV